MKKTGNFVNVILVVLTGALFVLMLFLSGRYIDMRVNGISSSYPKMPENDKWVLSNEEYDTRFNALTLISPEFEGFRLQNGTMLASAYDANARKGISDLLVKYLTALLPEKPESVIFENADKRAKFIESITSSGRYIYASLYNELPSAAILPCILGNEKKENISESVFIKNMFILPDDEGNAYALCFDNDGNCKKYSLSEPVAYDDSELAAYTDVRGFVSFEFIKSDKPAAVFSKSFDVSPPVLSKTSDFYNYSVYDANTANLMRVFDFNPNMIKSIKSADKTTSYVYDGKELYIDPKNTKITYYGYDSGIHLSKFLKYNPKETQYSFADKVLSVKYLVNSLDRHVAGADAMPSLLYVTEKSGKIVFALKYMFDGIPLLDGNPDILVEISGNYVNKVDINAIYCSKTEETKPVLPQNKANALFEGENYDGYGALYVRESGTNLLKFVWTARKDGKNEY
ncbi:MAG: hypothetical protein K6D98_06040 [Clostridiales bacterium]|nr:hypothetical protein [Clostridiales bacterium]